MPRMRCGAAESTRIVDVAYHSSSNGEYQYAPAAKGVTSRALIFAPWARWKKP